MKNSQEIYKRININWVTIIISGGFQVFLVFAYIHQLGNNPIPKIGLIFTFMLWFFVITFSGRIKVIIYDSFAVFRSDIRTYVKIPINMIKSVNIKQFEAMVFPGKKIKKHQFDYSLNIIYIQLNNDRIYQITIKNAQEIKEEIEKRMLITNNIPSIV